MPTPLILVGAILLFIALLLALRLRICIVMQDDIRVSLRILCFKIRLFPKRKKKAKRTKKEKSKSKHAFPEKQKKSLSEKIALVRALTATILRKTRKHLRLHAARLHIRVATGDAAKTAVLYGVVCQSLSYLLALLDRITRLKAIPPDVSVTADYLSEKPSADIKLIFSMRVWGMLCVLFSAAFAVIRTKIKRTKQAKNKKNAAKAAAGAQAQKGNRHG